jgi:hypothetical protein
MHIFVHSKAACIEICKIIETPFNGFNGLLCLLTTGKPNDFFVSLSTKTRIFKLLLSQRVLHYVFALILKLAYAVLSVTVTS